MIHRSNTKYSILFISVLTNFAIATVKQIHIRKKTKNVLLFGYMDASSDFTHIDVYNMYV